MGQGRASTSAGFRETGGLLPVGGIRRITRLIIISETGKHWRNVRSSGVLSFGTCLTSVRLIVWKAIVPVSMTRLVTFDRKVKKDAFYFYKANWNTEEPFVYITNRRHRDRSLAVTDIMIFSNQPEVELFVNGKSLGRQKPDEYATFKWKGVALQDGENTIEARSTQKKNPVNDKVVWTVK